MTRSLTSPQDAALQAGQVPGVIFVQINFNTPLYVCNLPYAFTWNGQTWLGVGNLGSIEPIREQAQLEAIGVSLTISGVPSDMISTALSEQYQGKQCQIWYCPLDDNTQLISTPVRIFFNDQDQQARFPGDMGLQYVAEMVNKSLIWGRA